jgi:hypothetical protein
MLYCYLFLILISLFKNRVIIITCKIVSFTTTIIFLKLEIFKVNLFHKIHILQPNV